MFLFVVFLQSPETGFALHIDEEAWKRPDRICHIQVTEESGNRCADDPVSKLAEHEGKASPYPNDVVWENLAMTEQKIKVRTYVSVAFILLTLMLWSIFAALIQAVADIEFILIYVTALLSKLFPTNPMHLGNMLDKVKVTEWYIALNGYLTSAALA
eukprot:CAMPEP_0172696374 /NCGR_PEP_ID=MMETSP1074-20121228/28007_1 /TAXON_ID=2916 /ORGANISM="Ceratium fusus, Strain PA161109" /LENGTH=156 /DNA_ID=CAMNT_0013517113 /DNA_START=136 /DNA_END=603 /DNA_ORIENTATION=+